VGGASTGPRVGAGAVGAITGGAGATAGAGGGGVAIGGAAIGGAIVMSIVGDGGGAAVCTAPALRVCHA